MSNGGGLGLVGGGYGDPAWLERELALVVEGTDKPWGVGFLSWSAKPAAVKQALEHEPATVLISFGDPSELAEPVLAANDMGAVAVWAGESVDLITDLPPAAELVGTIATEAEHALREVTRFID